MISPMSAVSRNAMLCLFMVVAASLLSGCISLFPPAEPVQLYRFGVAEPKVQRSESGGPTFGVLLAATDFNRAAATDRILTVTGTQAAYIQGARWVTSSVALFDTALHHAFDAAPGPARLVKRGEIAKTDYVLKLDVRTFEARYDTAQAVAPTIVIAVQASLVRIRDQAHIGDRRFKAAVDASDNRVDAIAQAFDQGVAEVLGELVTWVDTQGRDCRASVSCISSGPAGE